MPSRAFFYLQDPAPPQVDELPMYLDFELSKIAEVFRRESAFGKFDTLETPVQTCFVADQAGHADRVSDGSLIFDASVAEYAYGYTFVPHTWRVDSPMFPFVRWCPLNGNTGNVAWALELVKVKDGAVVGSYTQHGNIILSAASGNSGYLQTTHFDEMSMDGFLEGDMIAWAVRRRAADAADTYTGTLKMFSVGFHFEKEKHGTNTITPGS